MSNKIADYLQPQNELTLDRNNVQLPSQWDLADGVRGHAEHSLCQ